MGNPLNFVKIARSIKYWEWYKNPKVKSVFIHGIIEAEYEDRYENGVLLHRGQFLTTYPRLAYETGLTTKEVRSAVKKLVDGGEWAVKTSNKNSVISVLNYDVYQGEGQTKGRQRADKRQSKGTPTIYKEIKKERSSSDEDEWYDDQ